MKKALLALLAAVTLMGSTAQAGQIHVFNNAAATLRVWIADDNGAIIHQNPHLTAGKSVKLDVDNDFKGRVYITNGYAAFNHVIIQDDIKQNIHRQYWSIHGWNEDIWIHEKL